VGGLGTYLCAKQRDGNAVPFKVSVGVPPTSTFRARDVDGGASIHTHEPAATRTLHTSCLAPSRLVGARRHERRRAASGGDQGGGGAAGEGGRAAKGGGCAGQREQGCAQLGGRGRAQEAVLLWVQGLGVPAAEGGLKKQYYSGFNRPGWLWELIRERKRQTGHREHCEAHRLVGPQCSSLGDPRWAPPPTPAGHSGRQRAASQWRAARSMLSGPGGCLT